MSFLYGLDIQKESLEIIAVINYWLQDKMGKRCDIPAARVAQNDCPERSHRKPLLPTDVADAWRQACPIVQNLGQNGQKWSKIVFDVFWPFFDVKNGQNFRRVLTCNVFSRF